MYSRTIRITWHIGTGVTTSPPIETDANQCLSVDTKTNNTLREARLVVELEAGARFAQVLTAFTVIVIEVQRTRIDRRLAVLDKTRGACLLRQNPNSHGRSEEH